MTPRTSSPPTEVLSRIAWAFRGDPFADAEAFDAAVREWQDGDEAVWTPDAVLPFPRVRVSYYGLGDDPDSIDYTQYVVELASDNGRYFTALELLYKLHNAVVAQLRDADHQYFEGLVLKKSGGKGGPLYEMNQGS